MNDNSSNIPGNMKHRHDLRLEPRTGAARPSQRNKTSGARRWLIPWVRSRALASICIAVLQWIPRPASQSDVRNTGSSIETAPSPPWKDPSQLYFQDVQCTGVAQCAAPHEAKPRSRALHTRARGRTSQRLRSLSPHEEAKGSEHACSTCNQNQSFTSKHPSVESSSGTPGPKASPNIAPRHGAHRRR
jgi:hypothetical protein